MQFRSTIKAWSPSTCGLAGLLDKLDMKYYSHSLLKGHGTYLVVVKGRVHKRVSG